MREYCSFFVVILFLFLSCSEDENPLIPPDDSDFSIFFLQDSNFTYLDVKNLDLDSLILGDTPWLNIDDVYMYDFSTHYIYLKGTKDRLFENLTTNIFFENFLIKPFVLIANNQRIYLGSLMSSHSSLGCAGPHIKDFDQILLPSDVIAINGCNFEGWIDQRSDDRIQKAFKAINGFHAGLEVILNEVLIVENSDTSTIKYSFSIKNKDTDDLFIPDPDLMGTELFHFYTNGPHMRSSTQHYYYSQYKKTIPPTPHDSWDKSWFVRLKSGESLNRTVFLKGYPRFERSTYSCTFYYSGPAKIEPIERSNKSGRYWIGRIETEKQTIVY
jgi:hypothetical protein